MKHCADCHRAHTDHTPVGSYSSPASWVHHPRLLCMGCVADRRLRGETWERSK